MGRQTSLAGELQSVTGAVEWDNIISTPTISTAIKRSGEASLRISSLTSGAAMGARRLIASAASTSPFFYRRYFRVDTLPTAANRIMIWNDTDNQTTPMVWINLVNDGTLTLNDEDGAIGSASSALTTTQWYRIEVKIDLSGAAGAHVVEAMIDGTVFATSSTRSISAGIFAEAIGGNLNIEAQTTGDWYFDDCVTNDNTGSFQNSYPGEGEIIHLKPDSAGDNTGWVGGTGSSFAEVDETTPDDVTTYIASETSGHISEFNLAATPAALESGDTINVVAVGFRATLSDATAGDPNAVLRIKASAGGTLEESANLGGNTTTWNTNGFSSPRGYKLVLYDLPGASTTAWTKADLDTTQIGVRQTATDTHFYRVSTLWLSVDHKPAAAVAVIPPKMVFLNQAVERANL